MPPQGFGRKDEEEQQLPSNLTTAVAITDKEDLEDDVYVSHC